jgi:hypothetical protein
MQEKTRHQTHFLWQHHCKIANKIIAHLRGLIPKLDSRTARGISNAVLIH